MNEFRKDVLYVINSQYPCRSALKIGDLVKFRYKDDEDSICVTDLKGMHWFVRCRHLDYYVIKNKGDN